MLDGMNEVRGGGGSVAVSFQSNCNLCPTENNTCWCTRMPECEKPKSNGIFQCPIVSVADTHCTPKTVEEGCHIVTYPC